ncbi:hypothetical protein CLF_103421 [Clonorchis sinensis]|uniref:Dystroglycan n=1 Tax=Clonorchis sinensis TaxID=79923 RepID=G7Y9P7_CLOSI|nr:hypothetical protein CLF_103421 [Clonorchis sinensis]
MENNSNKRPSFGFVTIFDVDQSCRFCMCESAYTFISIQVTSKLPRCVRFNNVLSGHRDTQISQIQGLCFQCDFPSMNRLRKDVTHSCMSIQFTRNLPPNSDSTIHLYLQISTPSSQRDFSSCNHSTFLFRDGTALLSESFKCNTRSPTVALLYITPNLCAETLDGRIYLWELLNSKLASNDHQTSAYQHNKTGEGDADLLRPVFQLIAANEVTSSNLQILASTEVNGFEADSVEATAVMWLVGCGTVASEALKVLTMLETGLVNGPVPLQKLQSQANSPERTNLTSNYSIIKWIVADLSLSAKHQAETLHPPIAKDVQFKRFPRMASMAFRPQDEGSGMLPSHFYLGSTSVNSHSGFYGASFRESILQPIPPVKITVHQITNVQIPPRTFSGTAVLKNLKLALYYPKPEGDNLTAEQLRDPALDISAFGNLITRDSKEWISFDPGNRIIRLRPEPKHVGEHRLVLCATTDNHPRGCEPFLITVRRPAPFRKNFILQILPGDSPFSWNAQLAEILQYFTSANESAPALLELEWIFLPYGLPTDHDKDWAATSIALNTTDGRHFGGGGLPGAHISYVERSSLTLTLSELLVRCKSTSLDGAEVALKAAEESFRPFILKSVQLNDLENSACHTAKRFTEKSQSVAYPSGSGLTSDRGQMSLQKVNFQIILDVITNFTVFAATDVSRTSQDGLLKTSSYFDAHQESHFEVKDTTVGQQFGCTSSIELSCTKAVLYLDCDVAARTKYHIDILKHRLISLAPKTQYLYGCSLKSSPLQTLTKLSSFSSLLRLKSWIITTRCCFRSHISTGRRGGIHPLNPALMMSPRLVMKRLQSNCQARRTDQQSISAGYHTTDQALVAERLSAQTTSGMSWKPSSFVRYFLLMIPNKDERVSFKKLINAAKAAPLKRIQFMELIDIREFLSPFTFSAIATRVKHMLPSTSMAILNIFSESYHVGKEAKVIDLITLCVENPEHTVTRLPYARRADDSGTTKVNSDLFPYNNASVTAEQRICHCFPGQFPLSSVDVDRSEHKVSKNLDDDFVPIKCEAVALSVVCLIEQLMASSTLRIFPVCVHDFKPGCAHGLKLDDSAWLGLTSDNTHLFGLPLRYHTRKEPYLFGALFLLFRYEKTATNIPLNKFRCVEETESLYSLENMCDPSNSSKMLILQRRDTYCEDDFSGRTPRISSGCCKSIQIYTVDQKTPIAIGFTVEVQDWFDAALQPQHPNSPPNHRVRLQIIPKSSNRNWVIEPINSLDYRWHLSTAIDRFLRPNCPAPCNPDVGIWEMAKHAGNTIFVVWAQLSLLMETSNKVSDSSLAPGVNTLTKCPWEKINRLQNLLLFAPSVVSVEKNVGLVTGYTTDRQTFHSPWSAPSTSFRLHLTTMGLGTVEAALVDRMGPCARSPPESDRDTSAESVHTEFSSAANTSTLSEPRFTIYTGEGFRYTIPQAEKLRTSFDKEFHLYDGMGQRIGSSNWIGLEADKSTIYGIVMGNTVQPITYRFRIAADARMEQEQEHVTFSVHVAGSNPQLPSVYNHRVIMRFGAESGKPWAGGHSLSDRWRLVAALDTFLRPQCSGNPSCANNMDVLLLTFNYQAHGFTVIWAQKSLLMKSHDVETVNDQIASLEQQQHWDKWMKQSQKWSAMSSNRRKRQVSLWPSMKNKVAARRSQRSPRTSHGCPERDLIHLERRLLGDTGFGLQPLPELAAHLKSSGVGILKEVQMERLGPCAKLQSRIPILIPEPVIGTAAYPASFPDQYKVTDLDSKQSTSYGPLDAQMKQRNLLLGTLLPICGGVILLLLGVLSFVWYRKRGQSTHQTKEAQTKVPLECVNPETGRMLKLGSDNHFKNNDIQLGEQDAGKSRTDIATTVKRQKSVSHNVLESNDEDGTPPTKPLILPNERPPLKPPEYNLAYTDSPMNNFTVFPSGATSIASGFSPTQKPVMTDSGAPKAFYGMRPNPYRNLPPPIDVKPGMPIPSSQLSYAPYKRANPQATRTPDLSYVLER